MAGRKAKCYVYIIKHGVTPLYVGKGTKGRGQVSAKKHGGELHIVKNNLTDDAAFKLERQMIEELQPQNNISLGGGGGRCKPKRKPRRSRDEMEMERVGTKVYCAKYLLSKLDESNCEEWGVSKVGISRLREVAYG